MALFTKRIKRDFLDSCAGIQSGSLRLTTPEGEVYSFGAGAPEAELTLHDWSVVTADGGWAAHAEHTIAVTADGPEILTLP